MNPVPIIWNDDVNNVSGHLDENARWRRPELAPGTCAWARDHGQIVVLNYVCPCGCGDVGQVPVSPGYGGAYWQWDSNEAAPTLTPSVLRCKPQSCGWHGHIVKGEFVTG